MGGSIFPDSLFNIDEVKDERDKFWKLLDSYRVEKKFDTYTELYEKAHVSHEVFGNIKAMDIKLAEKKSALCDYKPKKETIMQLCLALELTLEQASKLLGAVGYTFSKFILTDRVVSWCLTEKKSILLIK